MRRSVLLLVAVLAAAPAVHAADAPEAPLAVIFERPGPQALVVYLDRMPVPREAGMAMLHGWDADGRHSLTAEAGLRFARLAGITGLEAHQGAKELLVLTPEGRAARLPKWIDALRKQQAQLLVQAQQADREARVQGSTTRHLDRRVVPALERASALRARAAELGARADLLALDLAAAAGDSVVAAP